MIDANRKIVYVFFRRKHYVAWVAQSVEQGTENPCVGGSIPSPGTTSLPSRILFAHMTATILKAPAKLNVYLHIIGKNSDGMHILESGVTFLDLCDVIH